LLRFARLETLSTETAALSRPEYCRVVGLVNNSLFRPEKCVMSCDGMPLQSIRATGPGGM